MSAGVRLVAYNVGQGGSRDRALWERVMAELAPDLLFVQESRDPAQSWLPALPAFSGAAGAAGTCGQVCHWVAVPGGRWGSGLWVRDGYLRPQPVPEGFTGRVVAAVVEGRVWPGLG